MIIGMTGFAQSGKDTVGAYLVERYGFQRFGLADGVREAVAALDPIVVGGLRISHLLSRHSWESIKVEIPEVRRLLQAMGTEVGREIFGSSTWTDLVKRKMEGVENVVITDVRFANEAEMVREQGGMVWRVFRPGVGPVNAHPSDRLDFEFDYRIDNDGSIEELQARVDQLLHFAV